MNEIFIKQLINDYHIPKRILGKKDHIFTVNEVNNTFSFRNSSDLSIFISHGRIFLRSDDRDLVGVLRDEYKSYPGQWFAEVANMDRLARVLEDFSMKIDNVYPLLTTRDDFKRAKAYSFKRIEKDQIKDFKGLSVHCFLFNNDDKLALAYYDKGKLLALGGTSYDGLFTDEIGVEKFTNDHKGLATALVNELAYLTLRENDQVCPIYTTQFSHSQSINLAMRAGFEMNMAISASRK